MLFHARQLRFGIGLRSSRRIQLGLQIGELSLCFLQLLLLFGAARDGGRGGRSEGRALGRDAFCRCFFGFRGRRFAAFLCRKRLQLACNTVNLLLQGCQLCFGFGFGRRGSVELRLEIGKLRLRGFESLLASC